jgi:dienelactone hydrolase
MRICEALILLIDFAALMLAFERESGWASGLAVLAFLLLVIHLLVERGRWQMLAAYMACIGLLAFCFFGDNRISLIMGAIGLLMLLSSALAATVLPVFSLPRPDGPYSIGTSTRQYVRYDEFDDVQVRSRKLRVQFWYPTEVETGKRSAYRTNDAHGLKSHLRLVRTHSWVNVTVAPSPKRLPVILFSPGWKGHLTQNTAQFEMLSSHGFIVLSLEHTPALDLPVDFDPSPEQNLQGYSVEVERRARDVSFVLDQLEAINQNDPEGLFEERIDISRVGMFGYSFGGATTLEACWRDERLNAGINMDGMLFGGSAESGVEQPFLFMSSDGDLPSEEDMQCADARNRVHMRALDTDINRIRRSLARYGGYYLVVKGTSHSNYSDRPLYSPLRKLTHGGSIEARNAIRIVNAYSLAFFEEHLNGKAQPLLSRETSIYPEAHFELHPAPSAKLEPVVSGPIEIRA